VYCVGPDHVELHRIDQDKAPTGKRPRIDFVFSKKSLSKRKSPSRNDTSLLSSINDARAEEDIDFGFDQEAVVTVIKKPALSTGNSAVVVLEESPTKIGSKGMT
jgi:hypothetical protein